MSTSLLCEAVYGENAGMGGQKPLVDTQTKLSHKNGGVFLMK